MTNKVKTFKVEFFVVVKKFQAKHTAIKDFFESNVKSGHTTSIPLNEEKSERYQIKSLVRVGAGPIYKGVFGRCRYDEKPEQATDDGREADVELKPGHGLVKKNYFLYDADLYLLIYQRNSDGSHYARLQKYLVMALNEPSINLQWILTRDTYKKLMGGTQLKELELSFQRPNDPELLSDLFLKDAINILNSVNGLQFKLKISVGRSNQSLFSKIKDQMIRFAESGLARVAKIKVHGDDEIIDLLADKVTDTISIPILTNGRPDPAAIYAGLLEARQKQEDDLHAFFSNEK